MRVVFDICHTLFFNNFSLKNFHRLCKIPQKPKWFFSFLVYFKDPSYELKEKVSKLKCTNR